MRYRDGPRTSAANLCWALRYYADLLRQAYFEIKAGLQWPLDVYGDVAVRDSPDHKRS